MDAKKRYSEYLQSDWASEKWLVVVTMAGRELILLRSSLEVL